VTDEEFYDAEHPFAEAAAERMVVISAKHTVTLETHPESFIVIAREPTRALAEQTAACFRLALVDVLIDYAAKRRGEGTR
jgi:hypothetical protein